MINKKVKAKSTFRRLIRRIHGRNIAWIFETISSKEELDSIIVKLQSSD
jgi:hypothetical protein